MTVDCGSFRKCHPSDDVSLSIDLLASVSVYRRLFLGQVSVPSQSLQPDT